MLRKQMDFRKILCVLSLLFIGEVWSRVQDVVYEEAQRTNDQCVTESTVCADIFSFTRTVNGRRQKTERRVVNCVCADGQPCPKSTNHNIYDTSKHRLVMCQATTNLEECRDHQVAHEVHLNDKRTQLFSYTVVKCLCPHHLLPLPGVFNQSVKYNSTGMHTNHIVHSYTCNIPKKEN
ncbi:uncharacterized protein LOC115222226 [Argonauta hians]